MKSPSCEMSSRFASVRSGVPPLSAAGAAAADTADRNGPMMALTPCSTKSFTARKPASGSPSVSRMTTR